MSAMVHGEISAEVDISTARRQGRAMFLRRWIGLALIAASGSSIPAGTVSDFTLCPSARLTTSAAVGYQEKDKGWVTTGWWEMMPDKCEVLIVGSVKGREIAYYAEVRRSEYHRWWGRSTNGLAQ